MSWFGDLGKWFKTHVPEWLQKSILGPVGMIAEAIHDKYSNSNNWVSRVQSGEITPEEAYAQVAQGNISLNVDQEKYLDNMLSNQRTNEARAYESELANTDLLRAATQLGALGLSPSNVLSVGGSATPNVGAAGTSSYNAAEAAQERKNRTANAMIGMAGRMASSGIYGSALTAVKGAAAKSASIAAHSAYYR